MLTTFVLIIHLLVCIALILIILLQTGKGADIGAVFGGGSSQTVFGSTGATTFLSKVTIVAAVLFMCTSIVLTYFSDKGAAITERFGGHRVLSSWRARGASAGCAQRRAESRGCAANLCPGAE
jgi:protein translocase SecG subunit